MHPKNRMDYHPIYVQIPGYILLERKHSFSEVSDDVSVVHVVVGWIRKMSMIHSVVCEQEEVVVELWIW